MMENIWLEPAVKTYKEYFGNIATTIIDVGTRDGDDAEFFRQQLGSSHIYVIDANPIAIKETKDRYPDFKIFETAISNYNGTTNFVQIVSDKADEAGSSSIENYSFFEGATYNNIEVKVIRMDSFIEDFVDQDVIDIIKVDIEGYTYEFLEGLGNKINKIKMLHLETETFERQENHKNNNEVINFMTDAGFLLAGVSYEWGPRIQDQVWINPNYINSY
jgi:FkbM family methyltransferase